MTSRLGLNSDRSLTLRVSYLNSRFVQVCTIFDSWSSVFAQHRRSLSLFCFPSFKRVSYPLAHTGCLVQSHTLLFCSFQQINRCCFFAVKTGGNKRFLWSFVQTSLLCDGGVSIDPLISIYIGTPGGGGRHVDRWRTKEKQRFTSHLWSVCETERLPFCPSAVTSLSFPLGSNRSSTNPNSLSFSLSLSS